MGIEFEKLIGHGCFASFVEVIHHLTFNGVKHCIVALHFVSGTQTEGVDVFPCFTA